MKAKLIKVDDVYRLYEAIKHGISIIGTTDLDYQKTWSDICQKLSLKNCQAIVRGYDLDELAENIKTEDGFAHRQSFKAGFQKALELMGDKKFSEEDMKRVFIEGSNWTKDESLEQDTTFGQAMSKSIQSLQQTEWDVEIEMWFHGTRHKKGEWVPKLDADGCLILKRV